MTNNIDKFNETVGILVKAYMNDTLRHMDCAACAVGNICGSMKWRFIFCTNTDTNLQVVLGQSFAEKNEPLGFWSRCDKSKFYKDGLETIEKTGYTVNELARIEYAFEAAEWEEMIEDDEVWMFNGLMAVVDILAEIHGIDLQQKESAKLMFVK